MATQANTFQLRPEDIAYLLTLLKSSTSPQTTQQLVDAFRERAARSMAR